MKDAIAFLKAPYIIIKSLIKTIFKKSIEASNTKNMINLVQHTLTVLLKM